MWKSMRRMAGRSAVIETVEIRDRRDAMPYVYWIEEQPVRLLLPAGMLRMQGAFAYDRDHPFVQALHDGLGRLAEFYRGFIPKSLNEMYGITAAGRTGENLPPWELPWVMRHRRTAPAGEEGLSDTHGVSFYGPATPEKIETEYDRLHKAAMSIAKNGYQPDRYGDIEGHLMTNGDDVCFFIRGGKHRAAVLAYLGYELVPVQLRRTWPRVIDSRTSEHWPLVVNGSVHVSLAKEILDVYLRRNNV